MTVEIIHDQSAQEYGKGTGSNSGPLELQLDMLLTALRSQVYLIVEYM